MNKTRLAGILILITGIILLNLLEHGAISMVSGLITGLGGGLALTGKTISLRNKK